MPIDLLTLLTTAALFWLWTGTLALATAKSTEASSLCGATEVLIVGAGFAGLAAAKELQDNGLADFRIVEATNRIGGRVRSVQPPNFGGVWIEEGANWLETNNPIWDLAVKYKKDVTFSNLIDFSTFAYNPNDTSPATRVDDFMVTRSSARLTRASRCSIRRNNRRRIFPRLFPPPKDEGIVRLLSQCRWRPSSNIDYAIQWLNVDSLYAARDASITSITGVYPDQYFVVDQKGGLSSIAMAFANDEGISPLIDLQTTVTKIDYDYSNATTPNYKVKVDVTKSSSNSSINATSRLCNHYLANYVILTVPEAVLERNLIAFEPTLRKPTGPSTAGLYIKLFYKFNVRVGPAYNREFAMTVLNGPGSTDNNDQCIFWHNMDGTSSTTNGGLGTSTRFIPGSNIWICTLVTEAFEKLVQGGSGNGQRLSNATIDRLLDPLRKVFQTNITTPDYTSYYADWNFRDAFGRSAYSRWRIGATLADYADFYGGYGDIGGSKCQHNGCDRQNKWRLHLSGTFSCLKSYGVVWGAYNAGQRSARNVLAERGGGNTSIDSRFAACDDLGRSRFFPVLFGN